ncbi:MAG: hypothetical protein SF052_13820 [Bacteroidia bacterium]|nr:hypothetical protein [Bacteroidia bacterium]
MIIERTKLLLRENPQNYALTLSLLFMTLLVYYGCTPEKRAGNIICTTVREDENPCLPLYFSVATSHTGELLRLTVANEIVYEKISRSRFHSDAISIYDTLYIARSALGSSIEIHLDAFYEEIRLIDTTFYESTEGLEDVEIGVSRPLPIQEAWDNRAIPMKQYVKKYRRKVGLTRNAWAEALEMLKP